jgi:DNA-binding PadR family transcriptional regulator
MTARQEILEILRRRPGATGVDIHRSLTAKSRAGRWFGKDSVLAVIFGPSIGGMHVALMRLETEGVVRSEWGEMCASGHRRRRYYLSSLTPLSLTEDSLE